MSRRIADYTRYLSLASKNRKPSPIRELLPLMSIPGMISFGGGLPNPETFPIDSISIKFKDGSTVNVPSQKMAAGLQYSETIGMKDIVTWIREFQNKIHKPPGGFDNLEICMSHGSQDILIKSFEMLLERGDNLLVEKPTYAGSLAALNPLGINYVNVDTDGKGLIPSSLEERLNQYSSHPKKPRVLYTIPTGSNPSGGTQDLERKKRVYDLACKHDLLILEDDPYYFLQFDDVVPSYLSLDTEGRVVRFDSFSKIVSSGMRLGMATGPKPLIQQLNYHNQVTTLQPSGVSQVIFYEFLNKMGHEGFYNHTRNVAKFYKHKMELFQKYAEKHLTGYAEWNTPTAGMFLWIKLLGVEDSFSLIKDKAVAEKVILVPGSSFIGGGEKTPYVRASYSTANEEQMDQGLKRLANLVKMNGKF